MSSFIAAAPTPAADQAGAEPISNDGFFPDIDTTAMRAAMRIDGTVTPERLRRALVEAVLSVNDELAIWKTHQQAAGHPTLAEVPAPLIDGASRLGHRYLRAVQCQAHANLIERYRSFDATAAGERKTTLEMEDAADLRRDARWAISDILGVTRTTVDLI